MSFRVAPAGEFIRSIVDDAREGREFIPLIGSGFSAPSGILTGQNFSEYLAYTVYRVLARPKSSRSRWDLHSQHWPSHPTAAELKASYHWVKTEFESLCAQLQLAIDYDDDQKIKGFSSLGIGTIVPPPIPAILRSALAPSPTTDKHRVGVNSANIVPAGASATSEEYISEVGLRSLYDWRATLEFLSQVSVVNGVLTLTDHNPSVIDDFNRHITHDRQPNRGHTMLAHLAEPLRIRAVLTTNFDELIEKAFQLFSQPLKLVPVSKQGALPDYRSVRPQNCIVKLHGDLYETRADFSLDDEPTLADKRTFARYFRLNTSHSHDRARRPQRLLVMGYSASDARCVKLIKYLLDVDYHKDIRIYWCCFCQADVMRMESLFSESGYSQRLVLHQTDRPDLLLYQLYQRLVLCLPPGGLTYEFTHEVPPARTPDFDSTEEERDSVSRLVRTGATLLNAARTIVGESKDICQLARDVIAQEAARCVVSHFEGTPAIDKAFQNYFSVRKIRRTQGRALQVRIASGAVQSLRMAFVSLAERRKCLWFELQDFTDADAVVKALMRVISLRTGRFQLQHVSLFPIRQSLADVVRNANDNKEASKKDFVDRWRRQLDEFGVDAGAWTLFLYGRDVPGSTSGWLGEPWSQETYAAFDELLEMLAGLGFRIVYAPLSKDRQKRKQMCIDSLVKSWKPIASESHEGDEAHIQYCQAALIQQPSCFPSDSDGARIERAAREVSIFDSIAHRTLADFAKCVGQPEMSSTDFARLTFLYSMTLFRQSRHSSAFFSEGTYQCPFRFNPASIDNDWVRASESAAWIEQLQEYRVLFEKPGGYYWMHRDTRLGLRRALDELKLPPVRGSSPGYAYFGQFRARAHFWIGDWYFKAYSASSHVMPLIEAIYHRIETARWIRWACPKSMARNSKQDADPLVSAYRFLLFRSAMMEILKLLALGRQSLKMWLANPLHGTMWDGLSKASGLKEQMDGWIPQGMKIDMKNELKDLISAVVEAMEDTGRAIMSEGGESPVRVFVGYGTVTSQNASVATIVSNDLSKVLASTDELASDFRQCFEELGANELYQAINEPPATGAIRGWASTLSQRKAEWFIKQTSNKLASLPKMIWLLREMAYLFVRRAKLMYHSQDDVYLSFWQRVCSCCNMGIDFCKHLPFGLWREELLEKIKFQGMYGLALANLGRFFEAHRHLNEGHALLAILQGRSVGGDELAILCLRRAEVYLTQCHYINIASNQLGISNEKDKAVSLRKIRQGFTYNDHNWRFVDVGAIHSEANGGRWRSDELWTRMTSDNRLMIIPPLISESVRNAQNGHDLQRRLRELHAATLDDAWNELDRAESNLAGRSQSTLWWGRLCTLRLRAYGHLKWLPREIAEDALLFRKGRGYDAIQLWYKRGMRIARLDIYRQLRMIEYFVKAVEGYRKAIGTDELMRADMKAVKKDELESSIATEMSSFTDPGRLLQKYYELVLANVTEVRDSFVMS